MQGRTPGARGEAPRGGPPLPRQPPPQSPSLDRGRVARPPGRPSRRWRARSTRSFCGRNVWRSNASPARATLRVARRRRGPSPRRGRRDGRCGGRGASACSSRGAGAAGARAGQLSKGRNRRFLVPGGPVPGGPVPGGPPRRRRRTWSRAQGTRGQTASTGSSEPQTPWAGPSTGRTAAASSRWRGRAPAADSLGGSSAGDPARCTATPSGCGAHRRRAQAGSSTRAARLRRRWRRRQRPRGVPCTRCGAPSWRPRRPNAASLARSSALDAGPWCAITKGAALLRESRAPVLLR
jgi:hypothetical protein